MKSIRQVVTIQTSTDGSTPARQVAAVVVGSFGVHRSQVWGWCVSHLPTGWRAGVGFATERQGVRYARLLDAYRTDWGFTDPQEVATNPAWRGFGRTAKELARVVRAGGSVGVCGRYRS